MLSMAMQCLLPIEIKELSPLPAEQEKQQNPPNLRARTPGHALLLNAFHISQSLSPSVKSILQS